MLGQKDWRQLIARPPPPPRRYDVAHVINPGSSIGHSTYVWGSCGCWLRAAWPLVSQIIRDEFSLPLQPGVSFWVHDQPLFWVMTNHFLRVRSGDSRHVGLYLFVVIYLYLLPPHGNWVSKLQAYTSTHGDSGQAQTNSTRGSARLFRWQSVAWQGAPDLPRAKLATGGERRSEESANLLTAIGLDL